MERLNISLVNINSHVLTGLMLIIPAGFCYRIIEMYRLESIGSNSEWTGLILIVLMAIELYLLLMFIWLRIIIHRRMNKTFKLIQLLLMIVIGILPGIAAIYPAFIKG